MAALASILRRRLVDTLEGWGRARPSGEVQLLGDLVRIWQFASRLRGTLEFWDYHPVGLREDC